MVIHIICLENENEEVAKRIEESYPDNYRINSTDSLVRTNDISDKVAINVGITGDKKIEETVGVVLKLNGTYSGLAPSALWEWLAVETQK